MALSQQQLNALEIFFPMLKSFHILTEGLKPSGIFLPCKLPGLSQPKLFTFFMMSNNALWRNYFVFVKGAIK